MKLNLAFSIPVIVREGDLQPNVEMQSPEFVNTVKDGKADPKLLIVKHPVGGLNEEELAERISVASTELKGAVGA